MTNRRRKLWTPDRLPTGDVEQSVDFSAARDKVSRLTASYYGLMTGSRRRRCRRDLMVENLSGNYCHFAHKLLAGAHTHESEIQTF